MDVDQAIAARFPWRRVKTFVDVGGELPVTEHRHLRRLPVTGDVLRKPLPEADVIVLREELALLDRAYDSLPEGGAVIVHDTAAYATQARMAALGFHASYVECLGDSALVIGLK